MHWSVFFLPMPCFSLPPYYFPILPSPFLRWGTLHGLTRSSSAHEMSRASGGRAEQSADNGETGAECTQLPNIISLVSNKTRELYSKNLGFSAKTREPSKKSREQVRKMIDLQDNNWIIRLEVTNKTHYKLNISILSWLYSSIRYM